MDFDERIELLKKAIQDNTGQEGGAAAMQAVICKVREGAGGEWRQRRKAPTTKWKR